MPVETLNFILGLGTIALQAATLVLVLAYVWRDTFAPAGALVRFAGSRGLWAAFLLSAAGVLATLYYSEVVGYVPCGLCWVTRIFFYPQVILFALALYKQDRGVADYSIALSLPGAVVALYTHYLQMGGSALIPCPASGEGECGKRYVYEFDYVTMPLMGFTFLVFLTVLMYIVRRTRA